jgi:hypothetical protein
MTPLEREVIEHVAAAGGKVPPKTFVGRGHVVAWCVRRGWLDWERGNAPNSLTATALFITDKGRDAAARGETR